LSNVMRAKCRLIKLSQPQSKFIWFSNLKKTRPNRRGQVPTVEAYNILGSISDWPQTFFGEFRYPPMAQDPTNNVVNQKNWTHDELFQVIFFFFFFLTGQPRDNRGQDFSWRGDVWTLKDHNQTLIQKLKGYQHSSQRFHPWRHQFSSIFFRFCSWVVLWGLKTQLLVVEWLADPTTRDPLYSW